MGLDLPKMSFASNSSPARAVMTGTNGTAACETCLRACSITPLPDRQLGF